MHLLIMLKNRIRLFQALIHNFKFGPCFAFACLKMLVTPSRNHAEIRADALQRYSDRLVSKVAVPKEKYHQARDLSFIPIWFFWDRPINDAPLIVQSCFRRMKQCVPSHARLIVLSLSNLSEYIEICPRTIARLQKRKISLPWFTDYLRWTLLARYGGLWVDSTIFLNENVLPVIFSKKHFFSVKQHSPFISLDNTISKGRWANQFLFFPDRDSLFAIIMSLSIKTVMAKCGNPPDYLFADYLINSCYKYIPEANTWINELPVSCEDMLYMWKHITDRVMPELFISIRQKAPIAKLFWRLEQPFEKNTLGSWLASIDPTP